MAAARNKRMEAPVEFEPEDLPPEEEPAAEAPPAEEAEPPPPRRSKARAPESDARPRKKRILSRGSRSGSRARGESGDERQRKLPFGSLVSRDILTRRAAIVGGSIIFPMLIVAGLVVGYYLLAGSQFFALRDVDVEGNTLLSKEEVKTMVRESVKSGVLQADLAKVRATLESYPLIHSAQVVRLLPDRLRVTITERKPVALALLADGTQACVDDEGKLFGDQNTWRGTIPPLIRGLAEAGERKDEINRQWLMIYRQLMADLDQNEPPLSSRISEITFDQDQGVRLTLANSRIVVLVGRADFRARLNAALDVIEAVNSRDAEHLNVMRIADADRLLSGIPIKYLNVTDPNRVVVGLDE
jgi:cell division protein FtsQ